MKKLSVLILGLAFVTFTSCKKEEKTETPTETKEEVKGLTIVNDSTKVKWTAFKTTDKVAVGGSFTQIELKDVKTGTSPEQVLEGVAFSIPVSSLFTNNPDRDSKLKTFFFGTLKNTELLSGILNFRDNQLFMTLSMNDVTKQIPLEYTFENNLLSMKTTLNLNDFGGEKALAAINKVCYDLHKGPDGVSKTWETVDIMGEVLFQ
ncbi:YceI family protein [Flavobacterium gelidilacus]|uniref:YceI family protein n=1 Tax=Flavobacterium gelidilacus TaxID=206041 RepID=UPI0004133700|nr:YceI family protein [Flavobacterium gelidilacus]